jgi:hypothetical protein
VGVTGYCAAKKDGCETQFIAGFVQASLQKLINMNNEDADGTIEFSVEVTGSSVHVTKTKYTEHGEKESGNF